MNGETTLTIPALGDEFSPEQLRQAQLRVAERARDAGECRDLLAMLGLLAPAEKPATAGPLTCRECRRPMMPSLIPGRVPAGWGRQQSGNQCVACYKRTRKQRTGTVEAPVGVAAVQRPDRRGRRRSGCKAQDLDFQVRVAELREVHGRTWVQIATELGCATDTARSAFARVVTR